MKVDALLETGLDEALPQRIAELEAMGYDGFAMAETSHDPFLPLVVAAEHSRRMELITSIAVAFARNPMILASLANDLHAYSKGRFILGLGSQIKPHIEKRFSMPWSHPAARMREMIQALHAIWATWEEGAPLNFRGEFYTHTLMTPAFSPEKHGLGRPKVFLAAVGQGMTEVAGEVADGLLVHGFTTEKYMREVTLPTIEAGLAKSGRKRADFQVSFPIFVVSGADQESFEKARAGIKQRVAFYGSTPNYKPVLDRHGWGELQPELNLLSKQGRWKEMGELIGDDVLDAFAVVAEPDQVAAKIRARYGDLVDRVTVMFPFVAPARRADMVRGLKAA
jgi:probable F420-dependent oxidoreductase